MGEVIAAKRRMARKRAVKKVLDALYQLPERRGVGHVAEKSPSLCVNAVHARTREKTLSDIEDNNDVQWSNGVIHVQLRA